MNGLITLGHGYTGSDGKPRQINITVESKGFTAAELDDDLAKFSPIVALADVQHPHGHDADTAHASVTNDDGTPADGFPIIDKSIVTTKAVVHKFHTAIIRAADDASLEKLHAHHAIV